MRGFSSGGPGWLQGRNTADIFCHRRGASGLAYGLIVGLIAVVAIGAISVTGSEVRELFGLVGTDLEAVAEARQGGGDGVTAVAAGCAADSADGGWTHAELADGDVVTGSRALTLPLPPNATAGEDQAEISCTDGVATAAAPMAVATACQAEYNLQGEACINTPPSWPTASVDLGDFEERSTLAEDLAVATDPDPGEVLQYSLVPGADLPANLSLDSNGMLTGTLATFAPAAGFAFDIRVDDGLATADRSVTLTVADVVPSTGLVAEYTMDNVINGGTTLVESVGGHDGSIEGATQQVSGLIGQALSFEEDNQGDRVLIPGPGGPLPSSFPSGNAPRSIFAWINLDGELPRGNVFSFGSDQNNQRWSLFYGAAVTPANNKARLSAVAFQNSILTDIDELAGGSWHLLGATHDGTTTRLYVDGVQVAAGPPPVSPAYNTDSTNPLVIGSHPVDRDISPPSPVRPREDFDGLIDQLRIYDRALTQSEIDDLFNGGSGI